MGCGVFFVLPEVVFARLQIGSFRLTLLRYAGAQCAAQSTV